MRKMKTILGILAICILITGIGIAIFALRLGLGNPALTTFIEKIMNETLEVKVAAYFGAVIEGDERKALAIWQLPDWEGWESSEAAPLLSERRESVTKELIVMGIKGFDILSIEWWRTCCEPGVIDLPREAGGARIRVQLTSRDNAKCVYILDVFHRETSYWGKAGGYLPRHWVLRDVYPSDQKPLFWIYPLMFSFLSNFY